MPRLLEDDAFLHFDPCTIEFPDCSSRNIVAVLGFFWWGINIVQVGPTEWLTNALFMTGVPTTTTRIEEACAAHKADVVVPFRKHPDTDNCFDVGRRMDFGGNSVCLVKLNGDNVLVGNCFDCVQHLGCDCPGANMPLRDHCGFPRKPMRAQWKTPANVHGERHKNNDRGDTSHMHWKGPSSTQARETQPARTGFPDYLLSLT